MSCEKMERIRTKIALSIYLRSAIKFSPSILWAPIPRITKEKK